MSEAPAGGLNGVPWPQVINAPESAIMGITRASQKPVNVGGGLQWRTVLLLSLSYDHRVINGADAARFCVTFADSLTQSCARQTQG